MPALSSATGDWLLRCRLQLCGSGERQIGRAPAGADAGLSRRQLGRALSAAVTVATTALADNTDTATAVLLMQYCSTNVVCTTTEVDVAAARVATGGLTILPWPTAVADNAVVAVAAADTLVSSAFASAAAICVAVAT